MGKRRLWIVVFAAAIAILGGCGNRADGKNPDAAKQNTEVGTAERNGAVERKETETQSAAPEQTTECITLSHSVTELETGFSAVLVEGNYGFDDFLKQGGAESDGEVLQFLAGRMFGSADGLSFESGAFGCSTISVENVDGGYYFGRNFDWNKCDAIVVVSYPENGYASFSTVNVGFIRQGAGLASRLLSDETLALAALYAPLDGMNEKGLCVSVNMIQDGDIISQNTEKPDITTTTALRLLLNQAATTDEAVALLEQYDFHASMDYMIHLAISDQTGKSVAVEYIDNEMQVLETPVLTNFYLAEGEKNGIGTRQSHTRFEILEKTLEETPAMNRLQVRDALSSVSKGNFGEFESTEWSVVFDQKALTAEYFHRENYGKSYFFGLFPE